jgi:hypothetical protein
MDYIGQVVFVLVMVCFVWLLSLSSLVQFNVYNMFRSILSGRHQNNAI